MNRSRYIYIARIRILIMKRTELQIRNFDEKDLRELRNAKEEAVIVGEAKDWRDFILKKCGVRRKK